MKKTLIGLVLLAALAVSLILYFRMEQASHVGPLKGTETPWVTSDTP